MNLDLIKNKVRHVVEQDFNQRDVILYALGLGYGEDPLNKRELPFIYEKNLKTVPTIAAVLCHPGFWAKEPEYGIDWVRLLHAEQEFIFHSIVPSHGRMRGEHKVTAIEDKGAGKGALLHQTKDLYDAHSSTLISTIRTSLFLRGNGGEGGFGPAVPPPALLPAREPDFVTDLPTSPRAALIYRLSGDWNPLHVDPDVAQAAGFERPILHGLCSKGMACRAVLSQYCDDTPDRLKSIFARFTGPVFPGETLRFEFFENGKEIRFRATAKERGAIVLDRCSATIS